MKRTLILGVAAFLCGCASQQFHSTGAGEVNTQAEFARWSDQQLEFRRAQLRHDLNGGFNGSPQGTIFINQMDRDAEQRQLEDMEAELLRRDPSGNLIAKSNSLLAYPN